MQNNVRMKQGRARVLRVPTTDPGTIPSFSDFPSLQTDTRDAAQKPRAAFHRESSPDSGGRQQQHAL